MTPLRFWLAIACYHGIATIASLRLQARWRDPVRCQRPAGAWLATLTRDLVGLALVLVATAFIAPCASNLEGLARLRLGSIATRLLSQAIFGELLLVLAALAVRHHAASQRPRAGLLATLALGLLALYIDAYHVEPRLLRIRHHALDWTGGAASAGTRTLRILHVTDIQTPAIGAHEERALRAGLEQRPDLIVMTGDYVQDEPGHPTEEQAARDLRALMNRIGFDAPLGSFATDGDVGPRCKDVFAGTAVRCLVNETALVTLAGGARLSISGLSRAEGRQRDPARLLWLSDAHQPASHRIVLSHSPDFVDALPQPVDLVLAGHTHGGQVVVPLFGPPRTASRLPRLFAADLHDFRGTPLHVSRGIGMERAYSPPVRLFCPPEICLLDVRVSQ